MRNFVSHRTRLEFNERKIPSSDFFIWPNKLDCISTEIQKMLTLVVKRWRLPVIALMEGLYLKTEKIIFIVHAASIFSLLNGATEATLCNFLWFCVQVLPWCCMHHLVTDCANLKCHLWMAEGKSLVSMVTGHLKSKFDISGSLETWQNLEGGGDCRKSLAMRA